MGFVGSWVPTDFYTLPEGTCWNSQKNLDAYCRNARNPVIRIPDYAKDHLKAYFLSIFCIPRDHSKTRRKMF